MNQENINSSGVYLVWKREFYSEYEVILVTENRQMAVEVSGELNPGKYSDKKNKNTEMWYEYMDYDVRKDKQSGE